jgi:glycosyltransferase involved in cell wall biosynthesis/tetratricopeptide (TPR) repeat protein
LLTASTLKATRAIDVVSQSAAAAITGIRREKCMTDLASVWKVAARVRDLGISRRSWRNSVRRLVGAGDRARGRKDWPEAARLYREALELDPQRFTVRVQLGHAYKELGDLASAGLCYRAALQIAPQDDDIYLQLGHLEKLRGNPAEAASAYRKSAELNPANFDACSEYAALAESFDLPPLSSRAVDGDELWVSRLAQLNGSAALLRHLGPVQRAAAFELRDRGDRARDAQQWGEAANAYDAYLKAIPEDFAIWVQLGHARKENGDFAGSETAYRSGLALRPDDADLHLQLGHVLKLRDQRLEATEAYGRSFDLHPILGALRELTALDECASDVLLMRPRVPVERTSEIFLDISDLLLHLKERPGLSGIQRVQLGLLSLAGSDPGSRACRFVMWREGELWVLPDRGLAALSQAASMAKARQPAGLIADIEARASLYTPKAGDIIVSTGVLYLTPALVAQRARLKRAGVRLGAYFYDFIPLTHPEYCAEVLTAEFSNAVAEALLHLDFALTPSEYVATEMRRLLRGAGYPAIPVRAVPLPHASQLFAASAANRDRRTPAIAALAGREYVLCVGTLCIHKNQSFLVQVWQLLVQQGIEPPLLVLAGQRNFGADEVLSRLEASRNVDGRVIVIDTPSDQELAVLYRNCLFTIMPSLEEGWGLPIGESLAYGKPCIASHAASMPEVGGDYAVYIDPYNQRACAELLRDLLADRSKLAALTERIRSGFMLRSTDDHARDVLSAVIESAATSKISADAALFAVAAKAVVRPQAGSTTWPYGKALPGCRDIATAVRGRMALAGGWRSPEASVAWMAGRHARIEFATTAPPGSTISVVMQFRVAEWSRSNVLHLRSACGREASTPVPEVGRGAGEGRIGRQELLFAIDCAVAADGWVSLSLEIGGPFPAARQDEPRSSCLGLVRLVCLLPAVGTRYQPNRRIRPAALAAPAGGPAAPIGLQSLLALCESNRFLGPGWEAPEPWGVWMAGATAVIALATTATPGKIVRVALQLRTAGAPSGVDVTLTSQDGIAETWSLPGDSPCELVSCDCRVADGGTIDLKIAAKPRGGRVRRHHLGLLGLAYGANIKREERLALTEALLYPREQAAALHEALLADLRFTVVGHLSGSYSLATINRSLAHGLEAAFPRRVRVAHIETNPVRDLKGVPERELFARLAGRAPDPAGAEVAIVQHWPLIEPPAECDLPLALFVWEESLVPREIVDHLSEHFRGVITQTHAVTKALLDSGVAVPVHHVGCAVDLSPFAAVAKRRAKRGRRPPVDRAHPVVFLHVSSCFPRKGVDLLLAAYGRAFSRDDAVRLVIKTFPNPHNDVAEQIERLPGAAPAVELIEEDLDESALLALYEAADVMVLPTRGEGFNLPAVEAMAAGLPLIVTAHGGHADFVGPAVARTLDYRLAHSQSHVHAPGSLWAEPDREDLVAALREAVARAGDTAALPDQIESAQQAVLPYGDRAAWGRRVGEVARALLTAGPPTRAKIGWVSTWAVRCGIAEYSRHLLSHFDDAGRDVTIFCEERAAPELMPVSTRRWHRPDPAGKRKRPAASGRLPAGSQVKVAWRVRDDDSIDELAAAIDAAGVDSVVVQHHVGNMTWAALARLLRDPRLADRPVFAVIHNVWYLSRERPEDRADVIDALRSAARVLVHAPADLEALKSYGLVDNVTLFPHGAEVVELPPPRLRAFTATDPPMIGAYGFFLPPKGFDRLIQALPVLQARWRGLRTRFVTAEYPETASAAELARCKQLATKLGVADNIEWITDYLPNERSLELLNECDLLVLPYHDTTESASGAVRVALASRAPVAVTPIRIFEELDDAVIRFAGSSVDDIAAGIAAILESEGKRRRLVECTDRWLEDHDWSLLAARLHGMVTGILATLRTNI